MNVYAYIQFQSSEWMSKRGSPSLVKGARLRTLSRRRSWVQIPPPALFNRFLACMYIECLRSNLIVSPTRLLTKEVGLIRFASPVQMTLDQAFAVARSIQ